MPRSRQRQDGGGSSGGRSISACSSARSHLEAQEGLGCLGGAAADFQSDSSQYGRGERHLSADVSEGDVVAYQTGTWFVDSVPVGDGSPAELKFCNIETIQVVWTHNCEHGVLRGQELVIIVDDLLSSTAPPVALRSTGEMVEFGPEQLVARIPVEWVGDDDDWIRDCFPLVELKLNEWIIKE